MNLIPLKSLKNTVYALFSEVLKIQVWKGNNILITRDFNSPNCQYIDTLNKALEYFAKF